MPPLTNLAHLDWLRVPVAPPAAPGHTTYGDPAVEMVWTYANRLPDGSYQRVGGGRHDPDTGRYGQGAFNADDVARAAIVYIRHWRATGEPASRRAAYQLLRGLAYLQTVDGPHAGNVVLWMQPDGTLNPSADPPEHPDPSDSAESFWLARTLWAFGEGYAAFRGADAAFGGFLGERFALALAALERQVLVRYGRWRETGGVKVPAWLITDGADATAEALLGIAAYVEVTGDPGARRALERLAEGVAAMGAGSAWSWPFGAVLPWAHARHVWHAWGGLAPAALARAHHAGAGSAALDAALADVASFTPHLLVATGPNNGVGSARDDRVQIAYGAHSRVESALAVAERAGRPALVALAGVAGAWFFGNNPAGQPVYDPATGRTYDGVDPPGVVHRDSGAESTVHGLLAMLALDANPEAAAIARTARVHDRRARALLPEPVDNGAALDYLTLAQPGTGHGTALVRSFAPDERKARISVPGWGSASVTVNDHTGRTHAAYSVSGDPVPVVVPGGGFAIVRR